jgi:hypothetical protein
MTLSILIECIRNSQVTIYTYGTRGNQGYYSCDVAGAILPQLEHSGIVGAPYIYEAAYGIFFSRDMSANEAGVLGAQDRPSCLIRMNPRMMTVALL